MIPNYIQGSVESISSMAVFDDKFNKVLTSRELPGNTDLVEEVGEDKYAEYRNMADYFEDQHILVYPTAYRTCVKTWMEQFLRYVTTNPQYKVTFTQDAVAPYYFKVSNGLNTFMYCPVVLTRALLFFLKSITIKCEAFKRHKSHVSDKNSIIFMELALTGKTNEEVPEALKPLAKACKAIKGKINPWYTEIQVEEEPVDTKNSEANLRFRGAEWFEAAQKQVCLIGAGGIGSNIAVSLCRVLGRGTLVLFDPDTVEYRNLAGQNFSLDDIGKSKVGVVREQSYNFNPLLNEISHESNYDISSPVYPIMITGLDNMVTRQLVFSKWKGTVGNSCPSKECLLIDARLSAEKWQIFCIQGNDEAAQKEYEDKWLFSDDEADSDICSYKQTAFAAQMCASFVTNLYVNFCTNLMKDDEDPSRRYLPFFTEYDASQMILRFKEA